MSIPVWLDCDPGNDDVFAILLAAYHPRLNLLGISTVHGNAPLASTTRNALLTLDMIHKDIPVYPGAAVPLEKPAKFALEIHGDLGLGGVEIPETTQHQPATDKTYLEAIHDAVEQHPNQICIVVTGTMTNLAQLFTKYPGIESKIRYVSIMGGAINKGNVTKYAEFNFFADPHAVNICLNVLGDKAILSPLNLTHTANATEEIRRRMFGDGLELRKFFYDIAMFYNELYITNHGITEGPPVHDPLAVYSLFPFVDHDFKQYGYEAVQGKCTVVEHGEREGELLLVPGAEGLWVGKKIDVKKFWDEVLDCLELLDRK